MKRYLNALLWAGLCLATGADAQESDAEAEAPAAEEGAPAAEEGAPAAAAENTEAILKRWEQSNHRVRAAVPRRWLFLQESGGAYGSPSPLTVERYGFDSLGWLQLAESDAIRLFLQVNPSLRTDSLKPGELPLRLKRYAQLTRADGIVLRTAENPPKWAVYTNTRDTEAPQFIYDKGPETLRSEVAAKWLVSKLGYDASVVAVLDGYLVLAKMRSVKAGSQGLILRRSSGSILNESEKDVGALLRVVEESDDYLLAKVLLSKSGKPKVPLGSKVVFDEN